MPERRGGAPAGDLGGELGAGARACVDVDDGWLAEGRSLE